MKIRFLATGVVRHIDNYHGQIYIDSGQAELVSKDDSSPSLPKAGDFRPVEPTWEVVLRKTNTGREELAVRMNILRTDYFYCGRPENANATVSWDGGRRFLNGCGREIPPDILQEYTRQWKRYAKQAEGGGPDLRAPASVALNENNAMAYQSFLRAK